MKTPAQINDGLPVEVDPKSLGGEERHMVAGNMRQVQHGQEHYRITPRGMENEMGGPLTRAKARKMLHEGMAHGKPLSEAQRGYFGVIASGERPRKGV